MYIYSEEYMNIIYSHRDIMNHYTCMLHILIYIIVRVYMGIISIYVFVCTCMFYTILL